MLTPLLALHLLGGLVKDEGLSESILIGYVAEQTPSQNQIRNYILTITPLGSTPPEVTLAIGHVLHKSSVNPYAKDFFMAPPTHTASVNLPEMYVAGCIGVRYNEQTSLWGTGTATDVVWYFNSKDRLINVVVEDRNTGP